MLRGRAFDARDTSEATSGDPITYLEIPLSLVLLTAILIAAYLQRGGRRGCIPWSHFDKSDEAARRKETA